MPARAASALHRTTIDQLARAMRPPGSGPARRTIPWYRSGLSLQATDFRASDPDLSRKAGRPDRRDCRPRAITILREQRPVSRPGPVDGGMRPGSRITHILLPLAAHHRPGGRSDSRRQHATSGLGWRRVDSDVVNVVILGDPPPAGTFTAFKLLRFIVLRHCGEPGERIPHSVIEERKSHPSLQRLLCIGRKPNEVHRPPSGRKLVAASRLSAVNLPSSEVHRLAGESEKPPAVHRDVPNR